MSNKTLANAMSSATATDLAKIRPKLALVFSDPWKVLGVTVLVTLVQHGKHRDPDNLNFETGRIQTGCYRQARDKKA